MYLIGTDIGTTGTKTVILDENGTLVSKAYRSYKVNTPKASWAEQEAKVWVEAVIQTLKESLEKANVNPKEVAGVSFSGLYGGSGVPVDKNMSPLYPCLIWMDRRAWQETQWVKDNIPHDKLFEITGNYVDSYFGFTKIMWIRDNLPDIWNKTYKFVSPKDYVIFELTGELSTDYSSAGNLGGVFDIRTKNWSKEMGDALGIPITMLPEKILNSHDIAGYLTKEMSTMTGLIEGTPIISGGIDAPIAQLSAGILNEGEHVFMAGTSTCWGTLLNNKKPTSSKLVNYPYVVEADKLLYTFGGSATTGALVDWFIDEFGQLESNVGKQVGISPYDLLELKAKKVPLGSEGLLALPYFMGERSPIWDPDARGVILGLSLYHQKHHVYRALMESAAYSLRHNMETAKESGIKLNPDCWIVGGVANSELWTKIFADVTGYNMIKLSDNIEAPLGDAFLVGLGTGIFKKPEEIKKWIKIESKIESKKENFKKYDQYYQLFLELYESTKDIMHKISKL